MRWTINQPVKRETQSPTRLHKAGETRRGDNGPDALGATSCSMDDECRTTRVVVDAGLGVAEQIARDRP